MRAVALIEGRAASTAGRLGACSLLSMTAAVSLAISRKHVATRLHCCWRPQLPAAAGALPCCSGAALLAAHTTHSCTLASCLQQLPATGAPLPPCRCWQRTQPPCALLTALHSEQQWLQQLLTAELLRCWQPAQALKRNTAELLDKHCSICRVVICSCV
jgi:hypothetical protein